MVNIVNKKALIFMSLMTCSTVYAASFDCTKASASYEKIICSDNVLNLFDDALSNNYLAVMNSKREKKVKDLLKQSQIAWLNKRNACSEYSCIRSLYARRVDEICEKYGSSTEQLNCISTEDISRQINAEIDIAKQEEQKNRIPVSEVYQHLVEKHADEVSKLGFSKTELSSYIYISLSSTYVRYRTLQEYLSLVLDTPGLKSISRINSGDYFGFKMKITGHPSTGFTFHADDGELYLNGLVAGDDIFEVVTAGQANQISNDFYVYAIQILDKNNAKLE